MNELINAQSPYLLQHKDNPVNWVEWSEKALLKARKENKLLLISIGYAACHWCHVMEHECFEDEEVAELMNRYFVNIKVDREERPDIDAVYMDAIQIITRQGGWPLNCVALPDGKPIHGGTYFPKSQWIQMLKQMVGLYNTNPQKITDHAEQLASHILNGNYFFEPATTPPTSIHDDLVKWSSIFDSTYGGRKGAPKFPLPVELQALLQIYSENEPVRRHVELTLNKMANGGINDMVSGGFCRYAVDETWKVPHFEKMLYDNAQLISLYSKASIKYDNPEFKLQVKKTIAFCYSELKDPEGGFFSSLDADSEGVEGKYYVWLKAELEDCLGSNFDLFRSLYPLDSSSYWEGNYVLIKSQTLMEWAQVQGMEYARAEELHETWMYNLNVHRMKRVKPALDNKKICSWNALMCIALFDAYEACGEKLYLKNATNLLDWMLVYFWHEEELMRINHPLKKVGAFLEDYSFFAAALLASFHNNLNEAYLGQAKMLVDAAFDKFYSDELEAFYFAAKSELFVQKTDMNDDVIPSSNAVMANVLHDLGHITGNSHYLTVSKKMLNRVLPQLENYPYAYPKWMELKQKFNSKTIVVCGSDASEIGQMIKKSGLRYALLCVSTEKNELSIFKNRYKASETVIFVCENQSCYPPVKTFKALMEILK